jgi:hypothetical protein
MYEITTIDRHGESDGGIEYEELEDALRMMECCFDPENVMYYSYMELHTEDGEIIATLDFPGRSCKLTNYRDGSVRKKRLKNDGYSIY